MEIASRFFPDTNSRDSHTTISTEKVTPWHRELTRLGVKKGDRVCVSLGNNIEHATTTYVLFKHGAILVPLNPAFTSTQIATALNHLAATHVITGTETNLPYKAPRSNLPVLQQLIPDLDIGAVQSEIIPSLRHVILVDNAAEKIDPSTMRALTPFEDVLSDDRLKGLRTGDLLPTDVINIQFTSGTTATPKAACLTHRNILYNGFQIAERLELSPADIVCCPPPLFHCFGSNLGYMATATHGAAIVFPYEAFDPSASLKVVQEEQCTALYGVPIMFIAMLDCLSNGQVPHKSFEHLRKGIVAGSNMSPELMQRLQRTLNLN